jgi:hypothetical protein
LWVILRRFGAEIVCGCGEASVCGLAPEGGGVSFLFFSCLVLSCLVLLALLDLLLLCLLVGMVRFNEREVGGLVEGRGGRMLRVGWICVV